ncbi:DoxX family protein [Methylomonas sp. HW2-6]|uniref:DoxX family protein n=1 Tax=Methylomonas TaxID=416 RepID=UPI00112B4ABE|nr:DoxX family protein [Methylomonas koyamae]TPQ25733.1 hypothetical protein C2U68_13560 [Methylomonas koyamae]
MNTTVIPQPAGKLMNVTLWGAQVLLALVYIAAGSMKVTQPIAELAVSIPWTGVTPESFVRVIGLIDLAGGIGILVPALTRIKPGLTVWAATGCSTLQICAMLFHLSRGEFAVLPINLVLLSLSLFVLWGRKNEYTIRGRI